MVLPERPKFRYYWKTVDPTVAHCFERCFHMNMAALIATGVTVLIVLGAIIFHLLFGASQAAALAGLGRLPNLPKSWRRFLFDEHNDKSN